MNTSAVNTGTVNAAVEAGPNPAPAAMQSLFLEAVTAAKAGRHEAARELFEHFTQIQPNIPQAWLWRAHLARGPEEQIAHLRQAQVLEPGNAQTRTGLLRALIESGIGSAKRSDKSAARRHFIEATRIDPRLENAWLWLASLADSSQERLHYVEKVLAIRPGHPDALAWRAELERHRATPSPGTVGRRRRILVVDDSITVRSLVNRTLTKRGLEVVAAADGTEALARLGETTPDLVFLDIDLPDVNGFELCKRIKDNDATRDVPVLMLSGKDTAFDKLHSKMVGAEDHISKPFRPEDLVHALHKFFPGEQA